MAELQFVRVTDQTLIVQTSDGVEFELPIDENLRNEVRRSGVTKSNAAAISPRAIQDAIREGATIEEIVEKFDADAEYVKKFAQPVLDELAHVIASARGVRIQLAGDRFADVTQIAFGDLVERRLQSSGADGLTWASHRIDLTTWVVTLNFALASGPAHASWTFDPKRLTLAPENETALTLSSAESLNAGPIPRIRPVQSDQETNHPARSTNQTKPINLSVVGEPSSGKVSADQVSPAAQASWQQDTVKLDAADLPKFATDAEIASRSTIRDAIARASGVEPQIAGDADVPTERPVEQPTPAAVQRPESGQKATDVKAPVDILDALRKKRQEREAVDELPHKVTGAERPLIPLNEPEPVTSSIRIVNDEPLVEAESSQLPEVEAEDAIAAEAVGSEVVDEPKETKRGRAGIPSWDEIVFGTKTDEN